MMYGMDTNLIMDGAGAGNGPRGISLPHVHGRYQNEQDIIENMPFSAGDSSALMSRQRPSSADSAESASMLDRRSSKESQKTGMVTIPQAAPQLMGLAVKAHLPNKVPMVAYL